MTKSNAMTKTPATTGLISCVSLYCLLGLLSLLCKLPEICHVVSHKNYYNCCYMMSEFTAKMHQMRFRQWLRPRPRIW